MVSGCGVVKMYYFAIEIPCGNALLSGTASGPGSGLIFEKIALSKWQLAISKSKSKTGNRSTLRQIAGNCWLPRQSGMAWDGDLQTLWNPS
jgi:hypothetical protein